MRSTLCALACTALTCAGLVGAGACSDADPRLSAHNADGPGGTGGTPDGGAAPGPGALRWGERFGGAGSDRALSIAAVGDAIAVAGSFEGDIALGDDHLVSVGGSDAWLAMFDRSGRQLWSKSFGGPGDDAVTSVAIDLSGSVLIAGSFSGAIDLGGTTLVAQGDKELVVARFYRNSVLHWAQRFGSDNDSVHVAAVAFDVACNAFVAGSFEGTFEIGRAPLVSAGASDAFVIKLDPDGNYQWSSALGDTGVDRAEAIAVSIVSPIVTGSWGGSVDTEGDVFVASLDAVGLPNWSHVYTGSRGTATSVTAGVGGDSFVAGSIAGSIEMLPSAGGRDVFVAAFEYDGSTRWMRRFGDGADQQATAISHYDQALVVAGSFAGDIDFGGEPLSSAGNDDVFVALLSAEGEHAWSRRFGDAAWQHATAADIADEVGVVVAASFEGSLALDNVPLQSAGASDALVFNLLP